MIIRWIKNVRTYRPASDLFVVYTDNYLNLPFGIRNRAFVIKLNYWWSV